MSLIRMGWKSVLLLVVSTTLAAAETPNLLKNGDFEGEVVKGGLPAGWMSYTPNGNAKMGVVTEGSRQGGHCVLVEASRDVKASLVSDSLPVAPGEKLHLSVWCRTEGLTTSSGGNLTFNAGFQNASRTYFRWKKGAPLAKGDRDWFQLTLEAEVPDGAAYATFQLGMNAMTGKTYWDAAELTAVSPVAVRFSSAERKIAPGPRELPLVLINRDPKLVGHKLALKCEPGNLQSVHVVTDKPEQPATAAFNLQRRGKNTLKVQVSESAAGGALASARREILVPPPVVFEPLLPTHWCLEDGPPQLEGRAWTFLDPKDRSGVEVSAVLGTWDAPLAKWHGPLPADKPVMFQLKAPQAGIGDYVVRLRLHRGAQVLAESEQDWHVIHRALAEVTVGPDGYLRVEGKPFFPIGMYNCGRFPEMIAAGYNVTHGYNVLDMPRGEIPNNQQVKDFLDGSQKAGMRMLLLVTHGLGVGTRSLGDEVVRRVRIFRNHPGLLAWDEEEGVARGEVPLSFHAQLREMLLKEAPNHPLMLGDTRDVITKVDRSNLFPYEHMDLGQWWWYPFPLRQRAKESAPAGERELAGESEGTGAELVPPQFLLHPNTDKPIWVGIQSYRSPRTDSRFPTPVEYRAQAYLAVVAGAKGLMYYVGYGNGGIMNSPEEGHWEDLKKLGKELRSMAPVFMSPDASEGVKLAPDSPVSVRLKVVGTGRVLLAVNRTDKPVTVKIEAGSLKPGAVPVRFEDRSVTAEQGVLTDKFGPYAVHVYEW